MGCKKLPGGQCLAIFFDYFEEMHNEVVLFEPSLVTLDQRRAYAVQGSRKQIASSILKFRRADPTTGLQNKRIPIAALKR